ncbi:MAG: hypothetical protein BRC36_12680 [Cyanobacteria bacterium QH_2_48_84]|nr:MAG: hypothetical protein BRC36_12680 [Cyanobacteria bacterium QH_2_48_84]
MSFAIADRTGHETPHFPVLSQCRAAVVDTPQPKGVGILASTGESRKHGTKSRYFPRSQMNRRIEVFLQQFSSQRHPFRWGGCPGGSWKGKEEEKDKEMGGQGGQGDKEIPNSQSPLPNRPQLMINN